MLGLSKEWETEESCLTWLLYLVKIASEEALTLLDQTNGSEMVKLKPFFPYLIKIIR